MMAAASEHRAYRTSATRVLGARARGEKGPERTNAARYCECGTKLSAYNSGDSCWAHSDRKPVRLRASYRSVRS